MDTPTPQTGDGPQDGAPRADSDAARLRPVDPLLLDLLVCPLTKTALRFDAAAQELVSDAAGLAYPVRDGIPIMLVDEARTLDPDDAHPSGR